MAPQRRLRPPERRLQEGVVSVAGTRPFIEERRFVWEGDRLAAKAAYGPSDTVNPPIRRTPAEERLHTSWRDHPRQSTNV
jgi:hypothetical protein